MTQRGRNCIPHEIGRRIQSESCQRIIKSNCGLEKCLKKTKQNTFNIKSLISSRLEGEWYGGASGLVYIIIHHYSSINSHLSAPLSHRESGAPQCNLWSWWKSGRRDETQDVTPLCRPDAVELNGISLPVSLFPFFFFVLAWQSSALISILPIMQMSRGSHIGSDE